MRHERSKRMHLDIFSLFLAENMLLLFKTHPILAQHFEEFHAFLDVIIKNIHISIDCKDSQIFKLVRDLRSRSLMLNILNPDLAVDDCSWNLWGHMAFISMVILRRRRDIKRLRRSTSRRWRHILILEHLRKSNNILFSIHSFRKPDVWLYMQSFDRQKEHS